MKRLLTALILTAAILSASAHHSSAFGIGGIVFDPRNFAENVLTAARTLQQINNQVKQIQNEIRMLENQARNLERLPDSISNQIRERLTAIDQLLRSADGISYRVDEISKQYEDLYRETYGDSPPSTPEIVEDSLRAWRQSRSGYIDALKVQAQTVENLRSDIGELDGLIASSQSASGNLQALQAGNQIQAVTAQQLIQMQELLAAQYRAEALEQSRILAETERGRARQKRFLEGNAYDGDGGS